MYTDSKVKVLLELLPYPYKSSEYGWAVISSNRFPIDLSPSAFCFLRILQHFWSIHGGTISETGLHIEKNSRWDLHRGEKLNPYKNFSLGILIQPFLQVGDESDTLSVFFNSWLNWLSLIGYAKLFPKSLKI